MSLSFLGGGRRDFLDVDSGELKSQFKIHRTISFIYKRFYTGRRYVYEVLIFRRNPAQLFNIQIKFERQC